jgi:hypothetical protein
MRKDPNPNSYAADTGTVVLVYALLALLLLAEGLLLYAISQMGL